MKQGILRWCGPVIRKGDESNGARAELREIASWRPKMEWINRMDEGIESCRQTKNYICEGVLQLVTPLGKLLGEDGALGLSINRY